MPNVFSNLRQIVANWFSQQRTLISQFFSTGTREVYPDINITTAITQGFDANAAVYSIVKKDAKKFGSVPRYITSGTEGKAIKPLENDLSKLINQPNPYQGQDAFLTQARAFYKVCGEAFIWLNRGNTANVNPDGTISELEDEAHAKKPVLEMYNLPPNMMIVVPDPDNLFGVYGYILQSNTRIPIRKVDVIHWKDINLDFDLVAKTHLRGMPALQPGRKTLTANSSATDATVRMNQNAGAKGAIVNKSMAPMNPKQETALRGVIDGKINSMDVKGQVAALQGDYSYLNFGLTSVDMELLKSKDYSMKELCFLFGLPHELFDSQTTFANKEMAQKGWVINEIIPDCKQLDNEMNRVLLKSFGLENTAKIESDFDELYELQPDKKLMIEWMMKGPFSINEIREATGFDPTDEEGSDDIFIPSGFVPLADLTGDGGDQLLEELYAKGNGKMNGAVKPVPVRGKL